MEKFKMQNADEPSGVKEDGEAGVTAKDGEEDEEGTADAPLSIRKSKMVNRMTVAELKQVRGWGWGMWMRMWMWRCG